MNRWPSLPTLAALAFLTLGAVLRLWYYLDARSLFIDEANLALNISELPYAGFFRALLYDQYAPPLFMVFSKGAVQLVGNHEWALRFWPLAGGLFLLFTFQHLNRELGLAPAIHWFPLAMLALSPFLLRYSTELKQYSTDAALALGFLVLAVKLPPEKMESRHFRFWAIAGGSAIWFSMPAVFMLCGVGAYYLYGLSVHKKGKAAFALALAGAVWMLSFIVLYRSVLQAGVEREMLQNYHAAYFFPIQLWEPSTWEQSGGILYGLLSPVLGFTVIGLITGIALLLWGSYRLAQQGRGYFILITVPILACFAASALHRFSLIPRVALFLMPLFLLLATYGASEAWKSAGRYGRLALLSLLILEAAPFANSLGRLGKPTEIEDLKGVISAIKESGMNGPAYVDLEAAPAYRYYSRYHTGKQRYLLPGAVVLQWDSKLKEVLEQQRQKSPGFWLVFSHLVSEGPRDKMARMKNTAEGLAKEKIRIEKTGAAGYWYEF